MADQEQHDDPAAAAAPERKDQALSFPFEDRAVRVELIDGVPWFVLSDVCHILAIKNASQASAPLEDDERRIIKTYTSGGLREAVVINESGLYALILRSNKPQAKVIRRWVTGEVLPAIRRTGSYAPPNQPVSVELFPEIKDAVAELKEVAESSSFAALRGALVRFDRHQDSIAETIGELNNLTAMILPETEDTIRSLRARLDDAADGLQPLPPAAFSYVHVDSRPVALLCRPDAAEGFSDPMMQTAAMGKMQEEDIPLSVLLDGVCDERRASWDGWATGRADVHVKYGVGERLAVGIGR